MSIRDEIQAAIDAGRQPEHATVYTTVTRLRKSANYALDQVGSKLPLIDRGLTTATFTGTPSWVDDELARVAGEVAKDPMLGEQHMVYRGLISIRAKVRAQIGGTR